jgi:hypothetical protein
MPGFLCNPDCMAERGDYIVDPAFGVGLRLDPARLQELSIIVEVRQTEQQAVQFGALVFGQLRARPRHQLVYAIHGDPSKKIGFCSSASSWPGLALFQNTKRPDALYHNNYAAADFVSSAASSAFFDASRSATFLSPENVPGLRRPTRVQCPHRGTRRGSMAVHATYVQKPGGLDQEVKWIQDTAHREVF